MLLPELQGMQVFQVLCLLSINHSDAVSPLEVTGGMKTEGSKSLEC